jgi:hypothetical protein
VQVEAGRPPAHHSGTSRRRALQDDDLSTYARRVGHSLEQRVALRALIGLIVGGTGLCREAREWPSGVTDPVGVITSTLTRLDVAVAHRHRHCMRAG